MKRFIWSNTLRGLLNNIKGKLFSSENNALANRIPSETAVWTDMPVNKKAFEVNIPLPGMDKNDVKIEVQNDCLVISSERQHENEEKNEHYTRKSFSYSSFRRIFRLPDTTDHDSIQARMHNGMLMVQAAKKHGLDTNIKPKLNYKLIIMRKKICN